MSVCGVVRIMDCEHDPPPNTGAMIITRHYYLNCLFSLFACFLLSVIYVASLYVWKSQHDRNHPSTIKQRFLSVFIISIISPLFLYICTSEQVLSKVNLWELLGLRWKGLFYAAVIPLILTIILFLGPICMILFRETKCETPDTETNNVDPWWSNIVNLIWWRNHIVAPLSEEFTFRACMLPLLIQSFHPTFAMFIAPLFFGVAHFHHMFEIMKTGIDLKTALLISCFQFLYTTIFGVYSAYLFLTTGHFVATFVVHSFCNHMGFPNFAEIISYRRPIKKVVISILFIVGLIGWCLLLKPVTNPKLYQNDILERL